MAVPFFIRTFAAIMSFTTTILQWFRENGRALPWRETKDAYAIWLSEIILQQTRIEQGRPYWERFMKRWPRVEDLARASEDEVLREWQGLGYYSRARNLHKAAQQVVEMGGFPQTLEGIKSLKGVGDYTAAAIGSIAFGLPAAVVDGNVYRVLARHYGIDTPINTTEGKHEFMALAQELLPETCVALHEGRVGELPVKQKTLKVKELRLTYIYIRYNGMTAIHRRGKGDIWQGLYEPWLTDEVPSGAVLLRQNVKHVLTHRVIYADFWLWEPDEQPALPEDYSWIREEEWDNYGVPRLIEIMLNEVNKQTKR